MLTAFYNATQTFYNEKEARDLVFILLSAVKYLHDRNIVHRDLKPENVLLTSKKDDAEIKLADFGFAERVTSMNSLTTQCGTPGYVAPEILKNDKYGKPVDMWSIGVITYILLGGYPPFHDENQRNLFSKIKRGKYEFHAEYWSAVSDEAKVTKHTHLTACARTVSVREHHLTPAAVFCARRT